MGAAADVLVATTSRLDREDMRVELAGILRALSANGVSAQVADWHDTTVDWAAAGAVLLRTVWDYPEHLVEFGAWLDRLEALGATVVNPARVARWNLDKAYLLDLAEHGAPIVPLVLADAGETVTAVDEVLVVKPRRGVGGVGARLVQPGTDTLLTADSVVTPFQSRIAEGELSVFVVDGEMIACVRKVPAAQGWLVHPRWGGRYVLEPLCPTAARAAAEVTFAAVGAAVDVAGLCYMRVDLVASDEGAWRVLEVEALEPSFYCDVTPLVADAVGAAMARRLPAG
ncbi:MAG: hypothetical protein QOH99_1093 [Frankiaceae bacterium]|nr:hypothetical protein [Frankiaceae bacterium]